MPALALGSPPWSLGDAASQLAEHEKRAAVSLTLRRAVRDLVRAFDIRRVEGDRGMARRAAVWNHGFFERLNRPGEGFQRLVLSLDGRFLTWGNVPPIMGSAYLSFSWIGLSCNRGC
jgi:hypothetical protein